VKLSAIALAAALLSPWPALADEQGGAGPNVTPSQKGESFDALFTKEEEASAPTTSTTSSTQSSVTYSLEPMCARGEGGDTNTYYGCGNQQTCGTSGERYWIWEHNGSDSAIVGTSCVEPEEAAPAEVLTPGRILEAFERIPLPESPLEVQPPGGVTLVNFDTILHTDAQPFTETVQLLNRQITFDIEPAEFTWTLGDGSTLSTTDPGRAWRSGLPMDEYVSHRYAKAGTVQLRLTTTWSARWRLPNGPWRPVDGTVDITSPPQQLEVTTARPQLVSYD